MQIKTWSLATWMISSVLAATACRSHEEPAPQPTSPSSVAPASRVVAIEASAAGFVPARVDAQPGEELTLRFTRTTDSGCLSRLVLPDLGISRNLELGVATDVRVVAPKAGKIAYECGMAMQRGHVVVSGTSAEPATTSSASASATAKPHADHEPRHGGVVTMDGDLHVEIVIVPDGTVDLFLSDDVRTPIAPAEISGTIAFQTSGAKGGRETRPLVPDPAKGSLSARTAALEGTTEYTWDLKARGRALHMTLAVPQSGTAAFASPTAQAATPGTKPVVRALGTGQVRLVLSPAGRLSVELLDASQRHASAKSHSAKVRLGGGTDVPLAYDQGSDVLRADLGPLGSKDHVDAVVTVTPEGGKPTALRVTFHLEQTSR